MNSDHLLERMLVHMPTGTGKTKTTMHIITNYINFSLKKKGIVIWIAHTTELLQQAYDTFESVWKHLGDGKINAYKLWGNKEIEDIDQSLDGIVFCGLAKIMSIADSNPKLYERLKKDCRLIVFDEAHKAAAKKTQKVIECLMRMPEGYENRALIGLTATPGRTTEDSYDNNLLTNMFGNKLIYIDSDILNQINMGKLKALNTVAESNIIKYFQERRILAKMEPHKLTYKMEFSESELKILSSTLRDMGYDDKEYTESQLKVLARNKERNLAILACLRQLQIDKKPTIVFACSVDHAKMLAAMLTLEGIPNSLVLGEMDVMDRKRAINIFKNRNSGVDIIINYEVLTTGFDSKNIKCVFITRPTKSIEFSLGQKFRYFIHDGVSKIKIVCDENPDVAVDVAPNDPLFLMEDNCVLCHQDDPKKVFKPGEANGIEAPFELYTAKGDATGEVQIPIKYIDKNGNKAESSVLVRFSIVKNKFYDETAFPKGINPGNYALGKHAAKMEGISVVRARREIDFRRFDYYNVVNEPQHRWWGCEIIFTPELDEAFGVANNKQYVELKKVDVEDLDPDEVDIPPIWDQLADTIISTIKAMYAQNKETRNNTRTFDDTQSPSTDIINTVENDPATSDIDDENEEDEETPPEVIAETGKEELKEIGYEDPTDEQGTAFINNSINFVYADKGERSPAFDYKPVLKTTVITINSTRIFRQSAGVN